MGGARGARAQRAWPTRSCYPGRRRKRRILSRSCSAATCLYLRSSRHTSPNGAPAGRAKVAKAVRWDSKVKAVDLARARVAAAPLARALVVAEVISSFGEAPPATNLVQ